MEATPATVTFFYEVEVFTSNDPDVLEREVLPALETSFNDFMLPELFSGECSVRRKLKQRRRLALVGISARPDDRIRDDMVCETLVELAGDTCKRVLGQLTLYSDEDRLLTDEDTVRSILREGMEDGSFNDVHSRIVRVSYAEIEDEDNAPSLETEDLGAEEGLSNLGIGMLSAAGALVVVFFATVTYRRRRPDNDETSTGEGGIQSQSEPLVAA